jgi:adenine/guanine phosphoribosyltransferase-like PRPP-binding protein
VEEATSDILAELLQRVNFGRIDGVAGIVTSGKIFAESIAERLRKPSLAIVVERENGIVSFSSDFYCEKRILLVDDVLSTAHTIQFAISAMQRNRCEILNPLSFFLNRSGLSFVSGYPVCSLISKPSDMWRESECPLCQNGSLALPLEGKKNWDRLVRE